MLESGASIFIALELYHRLNVFISAKEGELDIGENG